MHTKIQGGTMSGLARARSSEIALFQLLRLLIEKLDKSDEINFRIVICCAKILMDDLPKILGDRFETPSRWVELWADGSSRPAAPSLRESIINYILELTERRLAELEEV